MSLILQSVVESHLSQRCRAIVQLKESVSLPDATGYSETEPKALKAQPPLMFAEDFMAEHSTSVPAAAQIGGLAVSDVPQAVANQQNAQA